MRQIGAEAISFAAPDQGRDVRDIERLMRMTLPMAADNKYELEAPKGGSGSGGGRRRGPSRGGSGGGGNRGFGGNRGGGSRNGGGDRRPARAR